MAGGGLVVLGAISTFLLHNKKEWTSGMVVQKVTPVGICCIIVQFRAFSHRGGKPNSPLRDESLILADKPLRHSLTAQEAGRGSGTFFARGTPS